MKIIHKSSGITTGLGICSYFVLLFEINELNSKNKKLTDEQIAKKIAREFPHKKTAQYFIQNNKDRTINSYRTRYNRGYFTKEIPPKCLSFRYNSSGVVVNYRTGLNILFTDEIDKLKQDHIKFRNKMIRKKLRKSK